MQEVWIWNPQGRQTAVPAFRRPTQDSTEQFWSLFHLRKDSRTAAFRNWTFFKEKFINWPFKGYSIVNCSHRRQCQFKRTSWGTGWTHKQLNTHHGVLEIVTGKATTAQKDNEWYLKCLAHRHVFLDNPASYPTPNTKRSVPGIHTAIP